ncbi:MAG: hypothetical protein QM754_15400 [Tepidisphaeraceae bacterium]
MIYFVTILVGAITIFPIAHAPVAKPIAIATILFLLLGYGVGRIAVFGRLTKYIEVTSLSITAFLLLLPAVSETLRLVPNGHPLVTDVNSPVLKAVSAGLAATLLIGGMTQIYFVRRGRLQTPSPIEQMNKR